MRRVESVRFSFILSSPDGEMFSQADGRRASREIPLVVPRAPGRKRRFIMVSLGKESGKSFFEKRPVPAKDSIEHQQDPWKSRVQIRFWRGLCFAKTQSALNSTLADHHTNNIRNVTVGTMITTNSN